MRDVIMWSVDRRSAIAQFHQMGPVIFDDTRRMKISPEGGVGDSIGHFPLEIIRIEQRIDFIDRSRFCSGFCVRVFTDIAVQTNKNMTNFPGTLLYCKPIGISNLNASRSKKRSIFVNISYLSKMAGFMPIDENPPS